MRDFLKISLKITFSWHLKITIRLIQIDKTKTKQHIVSYQNQCVSNNQNKLQPPTQAKELVRLFMAGPVLEADVLPTCQFVLGWYQRRGGGCQLCPLTKLWLLSPSVLTALVQEEKCLQHKASGSPSVAQGGFRVNFQRSGAWLGAQDVGGTQQMFFLFILHPSSSNCSLWATTIPVLLLTFSSFKNTFKEFVVWGEVGVCVTYHHAVW